MEICGDFVFRKYFLYWFGVKDPCKLCMYLALFDLSILYLNLFYVRENNININVFTSQTDYILFTKNYKGMNLRCVRTCTFGDN